MQVSCVFKNSSLNHLSGLFRCCKLVYDLDKCNMSALMYQTYQFNENNSGVLISYRFLVYSLMSLCGSSSLWSFWNADDTFVYRWLLIRKLISYWISMLQINYLLSPAKLASDSVFLLNIKALESILFINVY